MQQEYDEPSLQKHLASLSKAIEDDAADIALKSAEHCLVIKQDDDIVYCKIIALTKLSRYHQAQQLLNSLKRSDDDTRFLKAYLHYRLSQYQEATDLVDSASNDFRMVLLKSQILCKRENYEASCDILAKILNENKPELKDLYEDVCSNFFNSLALYSWTVVSVSSLITLVKENRQLEPKHFKRIKGSPGLLLKGIKQDYSPRGVPESLYSSCY